VKNLECFVEIQRYLGKDYKDVYNLRSLIIPEEFFFTFLNILPWKLIPHNWIRISMTTN